MRISSFNKDHMKYPNQPTANIGYNFCILVCRHTSSGSVHNVCVCRREKTQDLRPPRSRLPIARTDVYGVTLRSMGRFALFFHEEGAWLMASITAIVTALALGAAAELQGTIEQLRKG